MQLRHLLLVAAVALLPVLASASADSALTTFFGQLRLFSEFKTQHGKQYATPELEAHRFNLFQQNMQTAAQLQQMHPDAEFGVTQFADMHPAEFQRLFLNKKPSATQQMEAQKRTVTRAGMPKSALPDNYDWRQPTDGRPVGVTPVKNQGSCGSCWAFSAVEAVESAMLVSGKSQSESLLSPQQTVSCDTVDGGCNGGDTVSAFEYMMKAGVQSEESYPYTSGTTGQTGSCKYDQSKVVAKVAGYTYATPGCFDSCTNQDEEKLADSLYNEGPVSICVDASPWQFYRSGIMSANGCRMGYYQLNHCVELVGYGVDPSTGTKFWSARNSWATSWGEAGHIRLVYGTNTCGVATEATQVTLA